MGKRRFLRRILACAGMALVSAGILWCAGRGAVDQEAKTVAAIRRGLGNHAASITVRFRYPEGAPETAAEIAARWFEAALEETDRPTEGDYLRYQTGGYAIESRCVPDGADYAYTVTIRPKYYMYRSQETAVTEALEPVMAEFGFGGETGDYEKVRAIYEYVCGHVTYDQVHRKNPYYHTKSTAYAALIQGTATCQGYSVLLYRMLRTAGVGCRVVTGTAVTETGTVFHAWNLAQVDGRYYLLDATWDAGRTAWRYFLRGRDCPDRIPGEEFLTEEFAARYPMGETDYQGGA